MFVIIYTWPCTAILKRTYDDIREGTIYIYYELEIIVPQTLNKNTLLRLIIHTRYYINIENIILFLFSIVIIFIQCSLLFNYFSTRRGIITYICFYIFLLQSFFKFIQDNTFFVTNWWTVYDDLQVYYFHSLDPIYNTHLIIIRKTCI